ncbi:MAG: hypothetical protein ABI670_01335 [Chloroflexota bacterium]
MNLDRIESLARQMFKGDSISRQSIFMLKAERISSAEYRSLAQWKMVAAQQKRTGTVALDTSTVVGWL